MSSVLRVYDPAECDEHGVPLDWEKCRTCDGGLLPYVGWTTVPVSCDVCGGHGSLKAAALAWFARTCPHGHKLVGINRDHHAKYDPCDRVSEAVCRCEGCGHPMSEGTWEGEHPHPRPDLLVGFALTELREGREPRTEVFDPPGTFAGGNHHFSPCDEGCRHGGPWRYRGEFVAGVGADWIDPHGAVQLDPQVALARGFEVEASWRQVDVRTLGWPHDLRPEKLAVLCLRCWAVRL